MDIEHSSRIAAEWTAWARTPNHDAFWAYRASLLAFIANGTGGALAVGCGEGRSRVLKECGYRGDGERSGREARLGSQAGGIGWLLQDRGGG